MSRDRVLLIRAVQLLGEITEGVADEMSPDEIERANRAYGFISSLPEEIKEAVGGLYDKTCRCNVGVQECPVHPGRLKTKEEKIAFRKAWDARVER